MASIKSLVQIITIVLLLFMQGCKGKDDPMTPELPPSPVIPTKPEKPAAGASNHLPLSLSTPNQTIAFKYVEDTYLPAEVKYSDGRRETIDYSDSKTPKEYRRYSKDELVYKVYYVTDPKGVIIKGIQYQVESEGKLLTGLGNYQITYNENKLIASISWYDSRNNLISKQDFFYNDKLYLSKKVTAGPNPSSLTYTYDGKQGLMKNVLYNQILSIENEAFYLLNTQTNVSSIIDVDNPLYSKSISMEYQTDGAPSAFILDEINTKKNTYKIIYR